MGTLTFAPASCDGQFCGAGDNCESLHSEAGLTAGLAPDVRSRRVYSQIRVFDGTKCSRCAKYQGRSHTR
jgi:hypothetical protein